jgi:hypothetical protein
MTSIVNTTASPPRSLRPFQVVGLIVPPGCNPLEVALNGRGFGEAAHRRLKPLLVRCTFDSCPADAIEGSQQRGAMSCHYSITSSARPSSVSAMRRPSAFYVHAPRPHHGDFAYSLRRRSDRMRRIGVSLD